MSETNPAAQADAAAEPTKHELFIPFEGVFRAEVRLWMGGGEPHVTHGTMTNRFVLMDRYLEQDFEGDAANGPVGDFAGKGYWGFDPETKEYQGFWIDTASNIMQLETGTVDAAGKIWTMLGEFKHPQTGDTIHKRSVITLLDSTKHKMESYFPGSDGSDHKTMEIIYTRAK